MRNVSRADLRNPGAKPNLSVAVERALRARSKRQALKEALDLSDAEHGPISEEAEEWGAGK